MNNFEEGKRVINLNFVSPRALLYGLNLYAMKIFISEIASA